MKVQEGPIEEADLKDGLKLKEALVTGASVVI